MVNELGFNALDHLDLTEWGSYMSTSFADGLGFGLGAAVKANEMPLTSLAPSPAYEKTIAAIGGYGEKVETPADLPAAIRRGLEAVRTGTPAVLNVLTEGR